MAGFAARAADQADRGAAMVAARVQIQRDLADSILRGVAGAAAPYRVEATVRAELKSVVHEERAVQESASPAMKLTGKSKVKLPGLGVVDNAAGATKVGDIDISGETRVTESVTRRMEPSVVRLTVLLSVEPAMPKDRRDTIAKLAAEIAGIDRARGDEVIVQERTDWTTPQAPPTPAATVAPTPPNPHLLYAVLAICVAMVISAALVGRGLARRGGSSTVVTPGVAAGAGGGPGAGAGAADEPGAPGSDGSPLGERAGQGASPGQVHAFPVLDGASPAELVQILAEAAVPTAVAILALRRLPEGAAKLLDGGLPAERRVELALGLAQATVVSRERLDEMQREAEAVLTRVRSRVAVGGPEKLADFLTAAPAAVRDELLAAVAAHDHALADATRSAMLLFDDLPSLSDVSVRQLVSELDPAVVALALVGADGPREHVHRVVSGRLRSILETEEEVARTRPAADVEAARIAVEQGMRSLHTRGLLQVAARPRAVAA